MHSNMKEIREGMLFKEVMTNPELSKRWILNFKGDKIRGVNANGVNIWFPKKLQTFKSDLKPGLLKEMRLKGMEGDEPQFFLTPDLTFIKNGILFQEIFQRPELEVKWIRGRETSVVKGVKISNSKIWFPLAYRRLKNELDLTALKAMPLQRDSETENKFFLVPPRPELIPDNTIEQGQTLENFLEDKEFSWMFNQHHGTISGVKVNSIPIYFPRAYQVSFDELDRDGLAKMRIKRSTIMALGYFLEP